jgi:hypothetical protein
MNARCLFALAWALCTIFVSSPAFAQTALFSQAVNYQPGSSEPSSVYLADVNGDGKLDIVVANQSGPNGHGSVSVYFGNGDGTVQAPITYDSGGPGAVSV